MASNAAEGQPPEPQTGAGARPREEGWRELLYLIPEVGRLFVDVMRDSRVPRRAKVTAGLVGAYLVSPVDMIPDWIPVVGQMDDAAMALWGVRHLLRSAGYDVLKDLWRGSDDGFALLLVAAGIER